MIEMRPLRSEDAEAYYWLRLEALETCPQAFSASPARHRERGIAGAVAMVDPIADRRVVIGAWDGPDLVGFVGFVRNEGDPLPNDGFVWGTYVKPAARSHGVGRAMMEELLAQLRGFAVLERATLEVYADNLPAARLYERIGFRFVKPENRAEQDDTRYMAFELR